MIAFKRKLSRLLRLQGQGFPMVLEPGKPQTLSLRGEVVEICERQGQHLAKIRIDARDMLDVAAESIDDAHLGDKVVIEARITIEGVKPE